ncbi:MAG: hypothetical protein WBG46_10355 [Nonlabens sp.]
MRNLHFFIAIILLIVSCDLDGYGSSVTTNGVEVFYKPDSIKAQAEQFSVMMDTMGYGKEGTVSFQIIKDSIVNINMVTMDQYHKDESLDYSFNAVALLSSMQIFKDESVQMHLANERFEIKRSLDKIEK